MPQHLSISTDRAQRMDGLTRIWDETRNDYLKDPATGEVLTFTTPYEAETWVSTHTR
jgi:hypothetical protein